MKWDATFVLDKAQLCLCPDSTGINNWLIGLAV